MALTPFIKRRRQQRKRKARNVERETDVTERNPLKKIEATVRKADEDKVENCTEDVDALLVFAGLYSAVLTAFLIESYKNLSADESESLLRRIAFQTANYSFSNGHLNTTFDPSQLPTFQAAVSDIRVNVCWFASLILSLSAASFGIAVKQWLREYLSIDCIDPLERLRIRHARSQGLRDWKLFQIAAFLPILLQIALALFFVGLCFFTAAVHRSIGITSLFLVSCWAFFFFMSAIAPLFSSRCPYRTTLLKVPFRYARPYIQSLLLLLRSIPRLLLQLFLHRVLLPSVRVLPLPRSWKRFVRRRSRVVCASGGRSKKTQSFYEKFEWHQDYMDLEIIHKPLPLRFCENRTDDHMLPDGEDDVLRRADDNDIIIFCDLDAVFLNDSLLDSMRRTLGHRLSPLHDALRFVTAVLQRRSGFTVAVATSGNSETRQPWPWTLSHPLRTALVDMLVESIESELLRGSSIDWKDASTKDSEWSRSFVVLVSLVSPRKAMPRSVIRLFKGLNEYRSRDNDEACTPLDAFSYQMKTQSDPDWPARLLLFLAQALKALQPEDAERCLRRIVHKGLWGSDHTPEKDAYRHLFGAYSNDYYYPCVPRPTIIALLEVARILLRRYPLEQTQDLDEFPEWIGYLLELVFDAIPGVKDLPNVDFNKPFSATSILDGLDLHQLLTDLFTTPQTTGALLRFFASHLHLLPSSSRSGRFFFLHWIDAIPYTTLNSCAIAVLAACASFFESHSILNSPTVLLRFCLLISLYDTAEDEDVDAWWQKLFTIIHARYERVLDESDDKDHLDANQFACTFSDYDDQHTDTCEIVRNILQYCDFLFRQHRIPNEMVAFLRGFVCASHTRNEDGTEFRLLKRLKEVAVSAQPYSSSGDEQKTISSRADDTAMVSSPVGNAGDQLRSKQHATICESSAPKDLPEANDVVAGAAAAHPSIQDSDATDATSGGDDGSLRSAGESPRRASDFGGTTNVESRDRVGADAAHGRGHGHHTVHQNESDSSALAPLCPAAVLPTVTHSSAPTGGLHTASLDAPAAEPVTWT